MCCDSYHARKSAFCVRASAPSSAAAADSAVTGAAGVALPFVFPAAPQLLEQWSLQLLLSPRAQFHARPCESWSLCEPAACDPVNAYRLVRTWALQLGFP